MPSSVFLLLLFAALTSAASADSTPLSCSETSRVCTAFLAFPGAANASLIESMFDAAAGDLTADPAASPGYAFVRKNCSCLASRTYLANTTYTIPADAAASGGPNATAAALAAAAYAGLAVPPRGGAPQRPARAGAVVALHLLCGCSSGPWNYLLSYVGVEGDTVESLSSRFGASMDAIEAANGMDGPDPVVAGMVYYIPLNSVPGQPYALISHTLPPAPAPMLNTLSEISQHHSAKFPYGWVIGSLGVALAVIAVALLAFVSFKFFHYHLQPPNNQRKSPHQPTTHKFQLLKSGSFCYGSGRYFCCHFGDVKPSRGDGGNHHITIPKGMVVEAFDREKPMVFTHEEILSSTDSFADANLLGHGTYGSVYYGVLRDQEVAIKRMTVTKTKEFIVEMRVLCKVHHASLN